MFLLILFHLARKDKTKRILTLIWYSCMWRDWTRPHCCTPDGRSQQLKKSYKILTLVVLIVHTAINYSLLKKKYKIPEQKSCIWEVLSWWLSQQKNVNFFLTLFSQCELYNHIFFIDFLLTYRSRQVIICKNITKKSAHPLSNKIQTLLNFWLIFFEISYLQN